jgi:NAD(P)H-flavin reductase
MRERPGKQNASCECTARREVGAGVFQVEFLWPGPVPRAGQFFLIRPERTGVFLGRPISVAAWEPAREYLESPAGLGGIIGGSGKGVDGLVLSFLIARRGRGTAEICGLFPGERAELTGPLGTPWEEAGAPLGEGPFALVSGGLGIAPLGAWCRERRDLVFDVYAGFRSAPFGLEGLSPRRLTILSEDGTGGRRGRVTDFFDPAGYGGVFSCGPLPMLRAVQDACAGVPCFLSLETRMACGVGACLGCTVRTRGGNRRCCTDGPIFNAASVRL